MTEVQGKFYFGVQHLDDDGEPLESFVLFEDVLSKIRSNGFTLLMSLSEIEHAQDLIVSGTNIEVAEHIYLMDIDGYRDVEVRDVYYVAYDFE